jgi:hypothetical protein
MSQLLRILSFNPQGARHNALACVLGDTIDLVPDDRRLTSLYSYAVVSAPGGSSAIFSGSTFTPDVAGAYALSVTCGADTLTVPTFCFATSIYTGLSRAPGQAAYSDAKKRQLLQAISDGVSPTVLAAWNAGTTPSGLQNFGVGT